MKVFTYSQYIKFIHRVRLNAVLQLAEENAKYNLEQKTKAKINNIGNTKNKNLNEIENKKAEINNNIDKKNEILKILKDRKEAAALINDFLEPQNIIKYEEIILYENNYINKKYSSEDWQIIYKDIKKSVFYLIKYQTFLDNEIDYKILNISVDIIQACSRNKKNDKNIQYPLIVPIVIYTGEENWKKVKSDNKTQLGSYILEKNQIAIEYNIIDINKISNQFLIQKNTLFSKALLKLKSSRKLPL